jgi:hypothetical protein
MNVGIALIVWMITAEDVELKPEERALEPTVPFTDLRA